MKIIKISDYLKSKKKSLLELLGGYCGPIFKPKKPKAKVLPFRRK